MSSFQKGYLLNYWNDNKVYKQSWMTFSDAGVPEPGQMGRKADKALPHSDLPNLRSGEEKSCGLVPAQVQILSPAYFPNSLFNHPRIVFK